MGETIILIIYKKSLYEGPVAIFTTPAYILIAYSSYVFRSTVGYCISEYTKLIKQPPGTGKSNLIEY